MRGGDAYDCLLNKQIDKLFSYGERFLLPHKPKLMQFNLKAGELPRFSYLLAFLWLLVQLPL